MEPDHALKINIEEQIPGHHHKPVPVDHIFQIIKGSRSPERFRLLKIPDGNAKLLSIAKIFLNFISEMSDHHDQIRDPVLFHSFDLP